MDITEIDKNFKSDSVKETDVEWIPSTDSRFALYGLYYDTEEQRYRRMPSAVASKVNEAVDFLAMNTAGGRLRFVTDSPYVALKVVEPNCGITGVGQCALSLYKNNQFLYYYKPSLTEALANCKTKVVPSWEKDYNRSTEFSFSGISYLENDGKDSEITLFFPLYSGVSSLYIGIKKGSCIKRAKAYRYQAPVVFYGSSITQGGCASRPGNDYVNRISLLLDCDVLNLGFSGNGKGEQEVARYIADRQMSAFVMDYDHNAPNAEHLQATHFEFYQTVRSKHKTIPIFMITRPTPSVKPSQKQDCERRRAVIYNSYLRAKEAGDQNVYFIDGRKLIGEDKYMSNTLDGTHPNDIGFFNIAKGLTKSLKKALLAQSNE